MPHNMSSVVCKHISAVTMCGAGYMIMHRTICDTAFYYIYMPKLLAKVLLSNIAPKLHTYVVFASRFRIAYMASDHSYFYYMNIVKDFDFNTV